MWPTMPGPRVDITVACSDANSYGDIMIECVDHQRSIKLPLQAIMADTASAAVHKISGSTTAAADSINISYGQHSCQETSSR
jgi:hypothetical protein